eukprot:5065680-Pleurochrysis_carterae.AAC.2
MLVSDCTHASAHVFKRVRASCLQHRGHLLVGRLSLERSVRDGRDRLCAVARRSVHLGARFHRRRVGRRLGTRSFVYGDVGGGGGGGRRLDGCGRGRSE